MLLFITSLTNSAIACCLYASPHLYPTLTCDTPAISLELRDRNGSHSAIQSAAQKQVNIVPLLLTAVTCPSVPVVGTSNVKSMDDAAHNSHNFTVCSVCSDHI
jgi:hypothetical protein